MNPALDRHWQTILALFVLTGVLTEQELIDLTKVNAPMPSTWPEIVAQISRIKNGEEL